MASILIIDDDKEIRKALSEALVPAGHDPLQCKSAEEGLNRLTSDDVELIFLDLKLPGMDGLEFLEKLHGLQNNTPVIVITGYADIGSSVQAMKLGARDYIQKPFNLEEILVIVEKVVEEKRKDDQLAYFQKQKDQIFGFGDIVGKSKKMKEVFRFIQKVAGTPKTTVLIRGETGTGKELVARAIHHKSERSRRPFIEINCSAFQETLLEAELFGYEPGAFTSATQRKKGLLEIAHKGSFFLDEIGDMNPGLQSKVLKVIEKQVFRRVGGTKEIKIDARIISATSRDLEKCIQEGSFREDLYYRLNVATVNLPPLRDRKEDVLLLANHFLKYFNNEFKKNIKGLTKELKQRLLQHSWPGNVRELKNAIERAVLFETRDYLSCDNISFYEKTSYFTTDYTDVPIPEQGISLAQIERNLIEKALRKAANNQTKAAKLLDISRETLKYRMKKFNITR